MSSQQRIGSSCRRESLRPISEAPVPSAEHYRAAALIAALGLAALGVAPAIQGTLANFFAGIWLAVTHPMSRGDSIICIAHAVSPTYPNTRRGFVDWSAENV